MGTITNTKEREVTFYLSQETPDCRWVAEDEHSIIEEGTEDQHDRFSINF